MELNECLVVMSEQDIQDFNAQIKGSSGEVEVCVRDHECEDGDKVSVGVEGRNMFSGELVNDWACETLEVQSGQSYAVELTALNGTGHKGDCSHADVNTGEIRVTGENTETQTWRHRGGAGSQAQIVVEALTKQISRYFEITRGCPESALTSAQCKAERDKACEDARAGADQWGTQEVSDCKCDFFWIGCKGWCFPPSVTCGVGATKQVPLDDLEDE